MTTPILHISDSLPMLLAEQFDPAELRHLAAVMEARGQTARARRGLTAEGVLELADMLAAGRKPTVGWWRRHRRHEEAPV